MRCCARFPLATALLATLLPAGASSAGPLAPTRASDLVTVVTKDLTPCAAGGTLFDTIVLPDGTQQPFAIPPKRVLVVTSLDFQLGSGSPGQAAAPVLSLQNGATAFPILQGSGTTDSDGGLTGNVVAPSGVAVRAGAQLCLVGGTSQSGFVHGFFAKDR